MKAVIEGLLFLSGEDGLTLEEISNIIEKDINEIVAILTTITTKLKSKDS